MLVHVTGVVPFVAEAIIVLRILATSAVLRKQRSASWLFVR